MSSCFCSDVTADLTLLRKKRLQVFWYTAREGGRLLSSPIATSCALISFMSCTFLSTSFAAAAAGVAMGVTLLLSLEKPSICNERRERQRRLDEAHKMQRGPKPGSREAQQGPLLRDPTTLGPGAAAPPTRRRRCWVATAFSPAAAAGDLVPPPDTPRQPLVDQIDSVA